MDLRDKVLHYAVDYTGSASPEPMQTLIDSGFDQAWLEQYNPTNNHMEPSPHSTLYSLSFSHFTEQGGLITPQTLLHQYNAMTGELAREQNVDAAELQATAQTILANAAGFVSNATEIPYVVGQIRDRYMRNNLIAALTQGARVVDEFSPVTTIQTLIGSLEQLQQRVGGSASVAVTVRSMLDGRMEEYEQRSNNPEQFRGMLTGFMEIDRRTNGLQPGEVVTVVGNTGIGKTKFREKILYNFWRAGHSVLEILSECFPHHTQERLECMALGGMITLPENEYLSDVLRSGRLTEAQKEAYGQVLEMFKEVSSEYCIVSPNAYSHLDELESTIAGLKQRYGIEAIGVDDFHNQRLEAGSVEKDYLAQGDVMTWLKRIAVRYSLVVLVEIQEKQGTVGQKNVDKSDVVAYSHKIAEKSDMIIRLFDDSGLDNPDSIYKTVQILKHKTSADHYSFPIVMDDRRMFIDNAPAYAVEEQCEAPLAMRVDDIAASIFGD